jgi:hypothetical protein
MNYQIVLFKNKTKKKIIKKFITHKRANNYFDSLMDESDSVIFDKKYENGVECSYELALLEKTSGTFLPIFLKDEYGRKVKVNLDDDDFTILKIMKFKIEELFLDYSKNKKIGLGELFKTYLKEDGLKLISKLNNKIIIQNDDKFNLLTFKNDDDSLRFIDNVSEHFINEKRYDCMFVKDYSTSQRKYLYNLLEENGFPKNYLIRHSTTHPTKT